MNIITKTYNNKLKKKTALLVMSKDGSSESVRGACIYQGDDLVHLVVRIDIYGQHRSEDFFSHQFIFCIFSLYYCRLNKVSFAENHNEIYKHCVKMSLVKHYKTKKYYFLVKPTVLNDTLCDVTKIITT